MTEEQQIDALAKKLAALGAPDPHGWAESEVLEGIPQLARFVFLREAWKNIVSEDDPSWIADQIARAEEHPVAPLAGIGHALRRLKARGASDEDLAEVVRGMQANFLFSLCYQLDDPNPEEPEAEGVLWALCQITEEGEVVGGIPALHESVLETDPTGRELRPRTQA